MLFPPTAMGPSLGHGAFPRPWGLRATGGPQEGHRQKTGCFRETYFLGTALTKLKANEVGVDVRDKSLSVQPRVSWTPQNCFVCPAPHPCLTNPFADLIIFDCAFYSQLTFDFGSCWILGEVGCKQCLPIVPQSFTEFFTEIHRENHFSVPLCAFSVMLCVQIKLLGERWDNFT